MSKPQKQPNPSQEGGRKPTSEDHETASTVARTLMNMPPKPLKSVKAVKKNRHEKG